MTRKYEKPQIADHGTLQQLTAACAGGHSGDAFAPSGSVAGIAFGTSNPAFGCHSN